MDIFDCFDFTSDGRMESVSASVLKMTGLTENHFVGRSYIQTYPEGEEEGRVIWEKLQAGERVTSQANLGNHPIKVISIPLMNRQQQLQQAIVFVLPDVDI